MMLELAVRIKVTDLAWLYIDTVIVATKVEQDAMSCENADEILPR